MSYNIQSYYNFYVSQLSQIYDEAEAIAISVRIFEDVLLIKRHLIKVVTKDLDEFEFKRMNDILARLMKHEPLQYVLGYTYFKNLIFMVDENVLIPRPETEELVDLIISENITVQTPIKILDIGTGSGCIPVSLKKHFSNAEVWAIDISEKALDIARKNSKQNVTEVHFIVDDILNPKSEILNNKFDIIVSNPPYVPQKEKAEMSKNVLDFEPWQALFVTDDDPLLFYRRILEFAANQLEAGGKIYFEISETYANEVKNLAIKMGYDRAQLAPDAEGKNRFLIA